METLKVAWRLLRDAQRACMKMGLSDRGNDLSLPHEVRMFAQAFGDGDSEVWRVQRRLKEMVNPHSEADPMMNDEAEALETLRSLGLKAIDGACDTDGASCEAHDAFRDALADYSDDVLWRLFERAAKPD
jgi:hypothetical protein